MNKMFKKEKEIYYLKKIKKIQVSGPLSWIRIWNKDCSDPTYCNIPWSAYGWRCSLLGGRQTWCPPGRTDSERASERPDPGRAAPGSRAAAACGWSGCHASASHGPVPHCNFQTPSDLNSPKCYSTVEKKLISRGGHLRCCLFGFAELV